MSFARTEGYLPIGAYGLIGDCRSAALVGDDGSIDWLCLPRFDGASVFGRILDRRRGGYWQICPGRQVTRWQRYRDLSNVLQTVHRTVDGRVVVTDFMPVTQETVGKEAGPSTSPRLVRIVSCLGGSVTFRNRMHPAPDYGRIQSTRFEAHGDRLHADAGGLHICIRSSCELDGRDTVHTLEGGESIAFALTASAEGECPDPPITVDLAHRMMWDTLEYWWQWGGRLRYDGPYHDPVFRSALALKLMTYAPTGAIVAAPTTSLPEEIRGERNWDYRFTWLRDASFTLFAFFQLGMTEEAHAFFDWLARTRIGAPGQPLDNLYDLDGLRSPEERTLTHLRGYMDSAPVRTGNGAARQFQLDVYGEVLDSAYLYARFGGRISRALWRELRHIVDLALDLWEQPDMSIWEVRGGAQHFTYSKVMSWVAVDRGLRLAERFELPHDGERWHAARATIHRRVLAQGWNARVGAFTQVLGGDTLDAAALRLSQVRFLSDRDPKIRSTVDTLTRELGSGELVMRYRTTETDDGLRGSEGAFFMCSFWLVDALAHMGELDEAQLRFGRLLSFASPLGLYSEEADPRTGLLLGNYPQAFTHLALIGAAVNIERLRHRLLGVHGLHGRAGTTAPPRAPRRRKR